MLELLDNNIKSCKISMNYLYYKYFLNKIKHLPVPVLRAGTLIGFGCDFLGTFGIIIGIYMVWYTNSDARIKIF